jgi:hypothetical protein
MNATTRWVKEWASRLECVKCRSKDDLILYDFYGKKVDLSHTGLEHLQSNVERVDFWCKHCKPKVNTRVTGPVRYNRKIETAALADLAAQAQQSGYDEYVLRHGHILNKAKIIDAVKHRPCMSCGKEYPKQVMEFHHVLPKKAKVSAMPNKAFTILEVIDEIQKCVLVCANCHRMIEYGYMDAPNEHIVLDGNFWRFDV